MLLDLCSPAGTFSEKVKVLAMTVPTGLLVFPCVQGKFSHCPVTGSVLCTIASLYLFYSTNLLITNLIMNRNEFWSNYLCYSNQKLTCLTNWHNKL